MGGKGSGHGHWHNVTRALKLLFWFWISGDDSVWKQAIGTQRQLRCSCGLCQELLLPKLSITKTPDFDLKTLKDGKSLPSFLP